MPRAACPVPNVRVPNVRVPNVRVPNVRVLVIGYGNSLRGDDGVGQVVAKALWSQRDGPGPHSDATIIWAEQLVPEMALELSHASVALFADAARDGRPPGTVTVTTLSAGPESSSAVSAGCWEDLTPASLLALCADLYRRMPPAVLITVSVDEPKYGTGLSAPVEAAVPAAVKAARAAMCDPDAVFARPVELGRLSSA
jgi:hydrogenase maturation protease